MPEADILYSDVRFSRRAGKTKEPISSSPESTYSEVKTVRQPSEEPSGDTAAAVTHTAAAPSRTSRVALLVLCALLLATVIALCVTLIENMRVKKHVECLTQRFKSGNKSTDEPCLVCGEGWEQHGGRCYYFYTKNSSWKESRGFCQSKGGDLVKIDSREEQSFLDRRLGEIMMEPEDKFWIGLTDSETEERWTWVDGSTLNNSLTFWSGKEPDNWTGENTEGENCVRMGELGGRKRDLKIWFDRSCEKPHRSVCEKAAE